tara:strand:+ start:110 stop:448 length:339 start_codon:yes stop_codon:yes gene_type:complete
MLTKKWCTVQFNAFLQDKVITQALKGGNTDEFYHKEGKLKKGDKYADTGTLAKSQMQVRIYPQYSRLTHRFGRIHHHVDYSSFKTNKLIRKKSWKPTGKINNYGMKLHKKED